MRETDCHWLLCPICSSKTRIKRRLDTRKNSVFNRLIPDKILMIIPRAVSDIPKICTTITGIPTSIIADKIRLNSASIPSTERKIGFLLFINGKLFDRSEPTAPKCFCRQYLVLTILITTLPCIRNCFSTISGMLPERKADKFP